MNYQQNVLQNNSKTHPLTQTKHAHTFTPIHCPITNTCLEFQKKSDPKLEIIVCSVFTPIPEGATYFFFFLEKL